jgi:HAMP domain-containing protein
LAKVGDKMPEMPNIRRLIGRILLTTFALALLASVGGFYALLYEQAIANAKREARIMLSIAAAVGDYTNNYIQPRLAEMPKHEFQQEMSPFFSAHTVFRYVTGSARNYTFRDPTINPTNPNDQPEPFDIEVIHRFRDNKALTELTGIRDNQGDKIFYLAQPITVANGCLECHSTPARAPPGMVARYGATNGFGWTIGDTVGVRMLTVPVTEPLRHVLRLVAILAGVLLLVFAVTYFALSAALDRLVARPLAELASAAEQNSLSTGTQSRLPRHGVREVRQLSAAIERLRISLAKALAALNNEV